MSFDDVQLGWDKAIGSMVVQVTDEWIVSVTPMIFNDRVLLTSRQDYPHGWTAGFCYQKGAAATLAAQIWDLDTQRYPEGFIKIAGDSRD